MKIVGVCWSLSLLDLFLRKCWLVIGCVHRLGYLCLGCVVHWTFSRGSIKGKLLVHELLVY